MFKKRIYGQIGLALALSFTAARATDNRPKPSLPGDFHNEFRLLSNLDPVLRDVGRRGLMGLSDAEVETLRTTLTKTPCTPAQADALEDIVEYVVTRAKLNPTTGTGQAFLGIVFTSDGFDEVDPAETPPRGVPIRPIPGFVAYRFLQDGDVVLGFGTGATVRLTQTAEDFRDAVSTYSAGEPMTLQVQRGAKLLAITLTPDRRPDDAGDVIAMQQRVEKAQADAQHYWAERFQPLLSSVE